MERGLYDGKKLVEDGDIEDYMNQKFSFKLISALIMDFIGVSIIFFLMDMQFTYIIPIDLFGIIFSLFGLKDIRYPIRILYGISSILVFLFSFIVIYSFYLQISGQMTLISAFQAQYRGYMKRVSEIKYKMN